MFDRGFKSRCERLAIDKRTEMGLRPYDPLSPFELAALMGIKVWYPNDVPGMDEITLKTLLRNDGQTTGCWSAVTVVAGKSILIILNSSHSKGRQSSDLMHEISHRVLDHATQEADISPGGIMLLKDYDKKQENEADWLSGCLLLPREALTRIQNLAESDAAIMYGVSLTMLRYRMNITGVRRQFRK